MPRWEVYPPCSRRNCGYTLLPIPTSHNSRGGNCVPRWEVYPPCSRKRPRRCCFHSAWLLQLAAGLPADRMLLATRCGVPRHRSVWLGRDAARLSVYEQRHSGLVTKNRSHRVRQRSVPERKHCSVAKKTLVSVVLSLEKSEASANAANQHSRRGQSTAPRRESQRRGSSAPHNAPWHGYFRPEDILTRVLLLAHKITNTVVRRFFG